MAKTNPKLAKALEAYFTELRQIRASGGATGERSYYPVLSNLLNAVGATLKPKVLCIGELADSGAGHPDFGLFAARQLQSRRSRDRPHQQLPERGVVELKPLSDDVWLAAASDQISRYQERYRLVLVTNSRDFVLVGKDASGRPTKLEALRLADSPEAFDRRLEKPRAFAHQVGQSLGEYLRRALSHHTTLIEPKDLAWLLASYARDALARVEAAGDAPSLLAVRTALEEALGVRFQGDRGLHFFHSTLVQTLFYGIFSAWVLWSRQSPRPTDSFDWRTAVWHLRAPVLRSLFQQLSDPGRLQPLGLVELLDWTAAALGRVDRPAFFARFSEGEAVPYFYEPFLEAFDPELRKQLGVWYTPTEVVRYMVARVDRALKDDLDIPDGLAAENVYVLDPCCGTGAYLAEVLRRIASNLKDQGLGALAGSRVKEAATKRLFGFEIMPAPFVVAHLQVGITMEELDAALAANGTERAQVFLTNALTGWEPRIAEEKPLPLFPELQEERDRAEQVKQKEPILVILGNPPYNGFAGVAAGPDSEERRLSEAYRSTKQVRPPEGQGLNDLYVRFFRMAERRIAEQSGRGVVCFISNYSWLDGLSFTGMRERYLEAFDLIRIDCLNGDKYKTGKLTPGGLPDPSIFSTPGNPVGIQVGTAIATLVRKADHTRTDKCGFVGASGPTSAISFRHLWGQAKREELLATAETEPELLYESIEPLLPLGLPFAPTTVSADWFDWPTLPELFPGWFPGVQTKRDAFLIDTDLDRLKARITDYFNPDLSHDEIARRYPAAMKSSSGFVEPNARLVRNELLARGGPNDTGFIRLAYRPFDIRWLYWEAGYGLLGRPVPNYRPLVFEGNLWLVFQNKARPDLSPPLVISDIGDLNQMNSGVYCVPVWLPSLPRDEGPGTPDDPDDTGLRPNISKAAKCYLEHLGANVEDLFYHALTALHDPTYNQVNADALRAEDPRVPLPGWPDGSGNGAAEALAESAARGRSLAALLTPDAPVPGITKAPHPEFASIAVPSTIDGSHMTGDDFALTAGWGHFGRDESVMPGQGHLLERNHTSKERTALVDACSTLGKTTFDIYLNDHAYWCNVPAAVWRYKLGGYQVLKKWLSYRERSILGRSLTPDESPVLHEYCAADWGTIAASCLQCFMSRHYESVLR
ncbi:MAG: N-6 DNA methylase [Truepera sp.]|nr:N-6 DNA methylase [Truepera sp.]